MSFEEKDKEGLHSLLFDALTIHPFDQVERLVHQLLDTGVPVTIKDEVIATLACITWPHYCVGKIHTSGSSSEAKVFSECHRAFNGVH